MEDTRIAGMISYIRVEPNPVSFQMIVVIKPPSIPKMIPDLLVFFQKSVNISGGPKLAPSPAHAYNMKSKITRVSNKAKMDAMIPTEARI